MYDFATLTIQPQINDLDERLRFFTEQKTLYEEWNLIILTLAFSMCFSFILKTFFNFLAAL
jgi:hypothetical protein